MGTNTILGRVALASGIIEPTILAEQAAVQAWFPYVLLEYSEEFFAKREGSVQTTIGDAVVVTIQDDWIYLIGTSLVPTATVGPNTYRHNYSYTYTSTNRWDEEEVLSVRQVYDCTFSGCPAATTGTCTAQLTAGTTTVTDISTLGASDLEFHPLALDTPLPKALHNSCGNSGGNDETKPTRSEATATSNEEAAPTSDDESAPEETPSRGWRASASWFGLVSGAVLALLI